VSQQDLAIVEDTQTTNAPALVMFDTQRMRALMDFADLMSKSLVTVPQHLHGKPADCMAIAMQAMRWGMDPFVVAQKTHIVSGKLGYEAQLVNAVVMSTNAIKGSFHYEYRGDGASLECRVGAVLRGEDAITWGEWLKSSDVQTKNSPLWKVNPRQQLGYLQVKNWARAYTPGAILGVYTPEEIEAMPARAMGDADEVPTGPRRRSEAHAAPAGSGVDSSTGEVVPPATDGGTDKPPAPPAAAGAGGSISGGQVAYLRNKLKSAGVAEQAICDRYQVASLELLSPEQFDEQKSALLTMV
jgi:hypothetical protein